MATFLDKNNEGVKRLSIGEYEEAAEPFKAAFDSIKWVLAKRAQLSPSSPDTHEPSAPKNAETNSISDIACVSEKSTGSNKGLKRKSHDHNTLTTVTEHNDQRRVRRRLDSSYDSQRTMGNNNLLCRPLWLEVSSKNNAGSGKLLNYYASAVLYNYAYTLQLASAKLELSHVDRRSILQKAMDTYSNVIRLSGRGRWRMILWMCCHNLQQLLHQTDETPENFCWIYDTLEDSKVAVLRSLAKTLPHNQVCKVVVSMLAVVEDEKAVSPAEAA